MNFRSTDTATSKCSVCVLRQFCLPAGLSSADMAIVDGLVKERVHLKKGESLYQHGDRLGSVYSVRFGSLKTEHCLADGRNQVIGFHLPGEIVGLDGIGDVNRYQYPRHFPTSLGTAVQILPEKAHCCSYGV